MNYSIFPSPYNSSSKSGCRQRPIRFACSGTRAYALHIADLIGQYFTSAVRTLLQDLGIALYLRFGRMEVTSLSTYVLEETLITLYSAEHFNLK